MSRDEAARCLMAQAWHDATLAEQHQFVRRMDAMCKAAKVKPSKAVFDAVCYDFVTSGVPVADYWPDWDVIGLFAH